MGTLIRAATRDDAAALAGIHVHSWQAAYRGLLPDGYLARLSVAEGTAWWQDRLAPLRPATQTWLLEEQCMPVGFAQTGPNRGDLPGAAELYMLYLLPEVWGRGLGRQLLGSAVAALRHAGPRLLTLWVLHGNARARRFYEAFGMAADGHTKIELRGDLQLFEVRYRLVW